MASSALSLEVIAYNHRLEVTDIHGDGKGILTENILNIINQYLYASPYPHLHIRKSLSAPAIKLPKGVIHYIRQQGSDVFFSVLDSKQRTSLLIVDLANGCALTHLFPKAKNESAPGYNQRLIAKNSHSLYSIEQALTPGPKLFLQEWEIKESKLVRISETFINFSTHAHFLDYDANHDTIIFGATAGAEVGPTGFIYLIKPANLRKEVQPLTINCTGAPLHISMSDTASVTIITTHLGVYRGTPFTTKTIVPPRKEELRGAFVTKVWGDVMISNGDTNKVFAVSVDQAQITEKPFPLGPLENMICGSSYGLWRQSGIRGSSLLSINRSASIDMRSASLELYDINQMPSLLLGFTGPYIFNSCSATDRSLLLYNRKKQGIDKMYCLNLDS